MRKSRLFEDSVPRSMFFNSVIATIGLCVLAPSTLALASVPMPPAQPPPEFQGSFGGIDLTRQWYDMLFWTRDRAKLVINDVRALARPNQRSLPTNIWGKSVVINFTGLSYHGAPSRTFGFYERENCTGRGVARAGLGAPVCSWNLRVIEIENDGWFSNNGETNNSSADWVSANLKPAALAAQFNAAKPAAGSTFTPNWLAFGDPKSAVAAGTFSVTLYRGASCPQVITGLVRLNSILRARDTSTLWDGPYQQMPPAGISPRKATLFLGASGRGADLAPDTTEEEPGFVNQVGEEVRRVVANCRYYGKRSEPVEFPSWPPSLPR